MFQFLRKLIVPIIVTVLVFFVAMIVLEWGLQFTDSNRFATAEAAGVINGESVSWQVYQNIYSNLYRTATNDTLTLTDAQEREVQLRAWNQVVHEKLLTQQADKHGIEVTDEEVYQYLRANPPAEMQQITQFHTNGQFDYQKYFSAMTNPEFGSFWASVEPIIRNDIRKLKMQEMVIQAAQVSENEIKEAFMANNETIRIGSIFVTYDRFTRGSMPPQSDDELKAYYESHKEEYKLGERAALNVAIIEKNPSDRDWNVAYKKLKAVHDSIVAGADFAEMARRHSDDVSKADGGDLGWFARGAMVAEFDRFSFSMKEGELSEPFKTQFGWHIILHQGYKEEKETLPGEKTPQLVKRAHVSHILIKVAPSAETIDDAHRRLGTVIANAKSGGFEAAAKAANITFHKTAPFGKGGNIQFLGNDANAGTFAIEHNVDEISAVMENNSSIYVVQVAEKLPAGMATFEEAKEKIKVDALRSSIAKHCSDTIRAIYAAIQAGTPMDKAASMHGATYTEMDPMTRKTLQRPIAADPKALGAAFSLTQVGETSAPIDFNQGSVIFKLLERSEPDLVQYNTARDSLYMQILSAKQQQVYSKWFEGLVNESKIENNVAKNLAQNQS